MRVRSKFRFPMSFLINLIPPQLPCRGVDYYIVDACVCVMMCVYDSGLLIQARSSGKLTVVE